MKKVVISTRQVIADIRARIGDAALMEKYSLSPRTLINLKKELLDRGLITPADIRPSRTPPNPQRKALSANEFVEDFRQNPNDEHLMARYNLTAAQLRTVYKKLIENRLLSEYEYYMREGASPKLEEPSVSPQPASSVVEEKERDLQPSPSRGHGAAQALPGDFFRDYSGIKIGQGRPPEPVDLDPDAAYQKPPEQLRTLRDQSTVVQLVTCELCPNCARPREDPSLESCIYCGIIFSKAGKRIPSRNIRIWRGDVPGD
jgi:hypothetical protein